MWWWKQQDFVSHSSGVWSTMRVLAGLVSGEISLSGLSAVFPGPSFWVHRVRGVLGLPSSLHCVALNTPPMTSLPLTASLKSLSPGDLGPHHMDFGETQPICSSPFPLNWQSGTSRHWGNPLTWRIGQSKQTGWDGIRGETGLFREKRT